MIPLQNDAIIVRSKTNKLLVSDWIIRKVIPESEDDSGFRFQALIKNSSRSTFKDLEYDIRYFDSGGKFVGADHGFSMSSEEVPPLDDKPLTVNLTIPPNTSRAEFTVKATSKNFFQEHNLVIFSVAFVLGSVVLFLSGFFKK
jgi:hypothetical protein